MTRKSVFVHSVIFLTFFYVLNYSKLVVPFAYVIKNSDYNATQKMCLARYGTLDFSELLDKIDNMDYENECYPATVCPAVYIPERDAKESGFPFTSRSVHPSNIASFECAPGNLRPTPFIYVLNAITLGTAYVIAAILVTKIRSRFRHRNN